MHFLLGCTLGMAALVMVLWTVGRGRGDAAARAALQRADQLRSAGARADAASRPEPAVADCLCNQCEQAPACALTFPECLQGRNPPG